MVAFEQQESSDPASHSPLAGLDVKHLTRQLEPYIDATARKIQENPWAAVGIALAAGVALGMFVRPLFRASESAFDLLQQASKEEGGPLSGGSDNLE